MAIKGFPPATLALTCVEPTLRTGDMPDRRVPEGEQMLRRPPRTVDLVDRDHRYRRRFPAADGHERHIAGRELQGPAGGDMRCDHHDALDGLAAEILHRVRNGRSMRIADAGDRDCVARFTCGVFDTVQRAGGTIQGGIEGYHAERARTARHQCARGGIGSVVNSSMAAVTRARVSGPTGPVPLMTRDAVICEAPARPATSVRLGCLSPDRVSPATVKTSRPHRRMEVNGSDNIG
jgi:hypothetical protein